MSYNIDEYVIGWRFNGLRDGEKCRIYLKSFSCGTSMKRLHDRTQTHSHAPTLTYTHGDDPNFLKAGLQILALELDTKP